MNLKLKFKKLKAMGRLLIMRTNKIYNPKVKLMNFNNRLKWLEQSINHNWNQIIMIIINNWLSCKKKILC